MSSTEGDLTATDNSETKIRAQIVTICKSREIFNKICDDTSSTTTMQHEIIDLLQAMRMYVRLDNDLRKNFSAAQLKSTLHGIVSYKFDGLHSTANNFSSRLQEISESFTVIQAMSLKEAEWNDAKFSSKAPKERESVVKKFQDRTRTAVEWKVKFEALKAEWDGAKDDLLNELDKCCQIIKGLRAGLDSNPEYRKGKVAEQK